MANNFYKNFGKVVKNSTSTNKSKTNKNTSNKNAKNNSTTGNFLEKSAKKLPAISKIIIAFFFIAGVVVSFLACKIICKNDCFEINGKKSISILVNDEYIDEGVKVITFGFDANSKVTIEVYENNTKLNGLEDIDTSKETTYQIVYKVSSIRFKDIQLIRTVTVVPVEEVAPEEDAVTQPEIPPIA